jgi:predicted aspartyl protease
MIRGTVTHRNEITVSIHVRDFAGVPSRIGAIVDTGFSGALTLPSRTIQSLNLKLKTITRTIMANGSTQIANVYVGTVVWVAAIDSYSFTRWIVIR